MRKELLKTGLVLGMLGGLMVPALAHADGMGVSLNVDLGRDDEAHFHFADRTIHHTPEIWKAAQQLQNAKHSLWKARNDYAGHKAAAIGAINAALDELRMAEEAAPARREHRRRDND